MSLFHRHRSKWYYLTLFLKLLVTLAIVSGSSILASKVEEIWSQSLPAPDLNAKYKREKIITVTFVAINLFNALVGIYGEWVLSSVSH